jgi:hypothetical protein
MPSRLSSNHGSGFKFLSYRIGRVPNVSTVFQNSPRLRLRVNPYAGVVEKPHYASSTGISAAQMTLKIGFSEAG